MRIIVLGSVNIDYTYSVNHITAPKESQASTDMKTFLGGKGFNQALTLARAGMETKLAAMVGKGGMEMLETVDQPGLDISLVRQVDGRSGHCIVQVDDVGQNSVMLYGGANRLIDAAFVDEVLADYGKGDVLLVQNEVSSLPYVIDQAYEKGMYIVMNPSPWTDRLKQCGLDKVSLFCLNEMEGRAMTSYVQPGDILLELEHLFPDKEFVLTLGSEGAFYKKGHSQCYHPALKVQVTDSTAAGDVFEGYFLAEHLRGRAPADALHLASYASALAIQHPGAALYSAPTRQQVEAYIENPHLLARDCCAPPSQK